MKIVIVGAGFSGSIMARKIVDELGYEVELIEKRNQVAGNMYDYYDENGILIQKYGPHFLNTNKYWIIKYLSNFSEMIPHNCSLLSYLDGKYVQLPYNFTTMQQLIGPEKSEILMNLMRKEFVGRDRVTMYELLESKEKDIVDFANMLYEKAFKTYSSKQWGIPIDQIDKSVINRVQFCIGFDNRYLNKDFQYLPKDGFTDLFKRMLNHNKIHLHLNEDANEFISFCNSEVYYKDEKVDLLIYTGGIDSLFKYKYGDLPYRTLLFKYDYYNKFRELPCEIVSYPQSEGFTRKTEYKWFTFGRTKENKTVVVSEYPEQYNRFSVDKGIQCYPIINGSNIKLYEKYLEESRKYTNLFLCGRLAEYKYYNMDLVIESTFEKFEIIKEKLLSRKE